MCAANGIDWASISQMAHVNITLRKPFYYFKTVLSLSVLCHGEGPFPGSEPNTNVQNRHSKKTIIGLKDNVGETIFTPAAQAELLKNFYWSFFAKMMQDPHQLIVNNATLTEVLKLKLLRLLLRENGQPSFDRRRMNETSSQDDALKKLNIIWSKEDNFFTAYNQPLNETVEDLLYRQELKDLLRKHSSDSIISNTIPVSSLKENVSLNGERGRIEKVMTSPQRLMHTETRDVTALVTEETGLLEDKTYECLFPLENQCFVLTTNSY